MRKPHLFPPDPLRLQEFLQAWERYLDYDDSNFLLQTAVVHAQFELIHPFKDGNGRIGRILIPLFLYQKKQLSQPMFYPSEYLESNREEYYQRLRSISEEQDWNGWIAFFLLAITHQARENSRRVKEIMVLYEHKPIFKTSDCANQLQREHNIHTQTLNLLRLLKDADVLMELQSGSGRRAATLCFPALLNLAEGREVL